MRNAIGFVSFTAGAVIACAQARAQSPSRPDTVTFTGMCDASGAVPIGSRLFAVADDEDNILRVYDVERGGAPLHAVDLSLDLPLWKSHQRKKVVRADGAVKKPKRAPESDLEAATLLDGKAFWLTSHGRKSSGKVHPARFILFATKVPHPGEPGAIVGRPYTALLDDMLGAESLRPFDLAAASERAPKEAGALNVEGLTATADGKGMLIGFRNPIPKGRALIVPLLNPGAMIQGARAELGPPILLDLGGLGIRSLSWWRGQYLIAAGHYADGGTPRLYTWSGTGAPRVLNVDVRGLNVEAFFTPEEREQILVLSDDGSLEIDGMPCKELKDPARKQFRGRWLALPSRASAALGR